MTPTVVEEAGSNMRKSNMRKWTFDPDAVKQAASVIERELMTVFDRLNIPCPPPHYEPVSTEAGVDEGLHRGERLYAAFEALGGLKEYFGEMLTAWELSPERQAEYPTENAVLDEYPDQASIDVRLANGFVLVRLATGKLAWVTQKSLEFAREWPFSDDLDGAGVLLTRAQSTVGTV
jgi:hypothetical protein